MPDRGRTISSVCPIWPQSGSEKPRHAKSLSQTAVRQKKTKPTYGLAAGVDAGGVADCCTMLAGQLCKRNAITTRTMAVTLRTRDPPFPSLACFARTFGLSLRSAMIKLPHTRFQTHRGSPAFALFQLLFTALVNSSPSCTRHILRWLDARRPKKLNPIIGK